MNYTTITAGYNTNLALQIENDGELNQIPVSDLGTPECRNQLKERCLSSDAFIIRNWNEIFNWPLELIEFLIELIKDSQGKGRVASVADTDQTYSDLFEATIALRIPDGRLETVAHSTQSAVLIARSLSPEAASHAADQIRSWLRNNNIQPQSKRDLESLIHNRSSSVEASPRITSQEGALYVMAALQERRAARGETEIETPPVVHFEGEIYVWTGTEYELSKRFPLLVTRILQDKFPTKDLTTQFINSVCMNIHALALLDLSTKKFPVRIIQWAPLNVSPSKCVNFRNGLLDLTDLEAEENLILATHDPHIFKAPFLDYNFDPNALCPLWESKLNEILPQREEGDRRQLILQEFFGYCLLINDCCFEKFLILYGAGANGKSVVLAVLRALLDQRNVSNMPLNGFSDQFRTHDMAGKLANIASDMQHIQRVDEGLLKQFVSGEPSQVNRKHKDPCTMHPTAKLVFSTNNLPQFSDCSEGLWRRMIVIPFLENFSQEQRELGLAERVIQSELPGILNWALAGARRLLSQQGFSHCNLSQGAVSTHRHDSDPYRQFLDEWCDVDPEFDVDADTLYGAYQEYCKQNGRHSKSKTELGKLVKQYLGTDRQRRSTEPRHYFYRGLRLRPHITARMH